MDKTAPVIIAKTSMRTEASVIKSLLESYNIPCHFTPEPLHHIYPLRGDGHAEISIFVPAPLAEAARSVLAEHRRKEGSLRLVEADESEQGSS